MGNTGFSRSARASGPCGKQELEGMSNKPHRASIEKEMIHD